MKLTSILLVQMKNKSFTTRPDTIFGASFIALSSDHPLSKKFINDQNLLNSRKNATRPELPKKLATRKN